ncbi:hypothetical protein [Sagittula sp. MA-2]|uniref:hypothetical protein n=1 Tax=Sagittula sp. MA-2 TaxID=3048007 RepID=UPI0024C361F1|nr:hypothetical protein [Sagittula sp. MA-2]WHZ36616.1 hypothetical protein QNI11_06280 [Sagittula sp. MA-2]
MNKFLIGSAVALALTTTSLSAAPIHAKGNAGGFTVAQGEQVWLAKGPQGNGNGKGNGGGNAKLLKKGNGNGNAGKGNPGNGNAQADNGKGKDKPGKGNAQANNGNGNGKGKPGNAGGPKNNGNGVAQAANGNGNGKASKGRKAYTAAEREEVVKRIVSTPAPAGRDMTRVIGATALALATPQLLWSDVTDDELITYTNCPPGLAKKDPPCVPPGLAKKGVTYDEWVSYDRDRYEEIWLERRDEWLGRGVDVDPDPDLLLLQSDQIAQLFNLAPAPDGQRYALIDGLPVLLGDEDYTSLLLVNQTAQAADLLNGVPIAPTAALTQEELINLYRLPQLGADENYAVVNGQLVQLNDSEYELLQMIRIARAVL